MNTTVLTALLGAIGLTGFFLTAGYISYLAWIRPAKFKEREVNKVKDWWPFAKYFRRYHGSNEYLWAARVGPIMFFLIFLFLGVLACLGFLGIIH